MLALSWRTVSWPLRRPFRIAYEEIAAIDTVWLTVTDTESGLSGRAEAAGVFYRGETAESISRDLQAAAPALAHATGPTDVQALMPPGGARNAADCALWDLAAKRAGRRAHDLAGVTAAEPRACFYTIGLCGAEVFESELRRALAQNLHLLKIKLDGRTDLERLTLARRLAPASILAVDANQSWTPDHFNLMAAPLERLGVVMIEQPFPRSADQALSRGRSPIPICADESCETRSDLDLAAERYNIVNIKLDKAGGLTEALALQNAALAAGMATMVGNMCGSSLSHAPAFLLVPRARFIDLDGPLLNSADCDHPILYKGSTIYPSTSALWG